jgi:hypothetical protein
MWKDINTAPKDPDNFIIARESEENDCRAMVRWSEADGWVDAQGGTVEFLFEYLASDDEAETISGPVLCESYEARSSGTEAELDTHPAITELHPKTIVGALPIELVTILEAGGFKVRPNAPEALPSE